MADDDEDGLIERYLLGRLEEGERLQVEEKIMADTEFFNLVLLAEDEMVEKYVQSELPESDRAEFEASFLSTPEGRQQVSLAKALYEYVKPPPEPQGETGTGKAPRLTDQGANEIETFSGGTNAGITVAKDSVSPKPPRAGDARLSTWWRQPAFRWASAAVIVVGLSLGIYPVIRTSWALSQGLAALNKAYLNHRPTESRISGLDYASTSVTRSDASRQVDTRSLNRAERILLDEAADHPSAASHHALGRLYLAEQKFDDAIREFDEALKTEPNNAQLHSDYGAALLEKGKADQSKGDAGKSLEEFAKSLEHLNRAIELDASLLEAVFNRSLCHEYLMLPRQAEQDWKMYLEKDPNSKWADEARQKLQELERQNDKVTRTKEELYQGYLTAYHAGDRRTAWEAFRHCRARVGNSIVEKLVDDHLQSVSDPSGTDAKDSLKALSYAGDLEFETVGDRFTLDLARFYERAGPTQKPILKRARELAKTGQLQIAQTDFRSAFETYVLAKRAFDQAGNECESKSAEYWLAICYTEQIDPQQGPSRFRKLAEDSQKNHYKWLIVRASNALANHNLILNEYSKAIGYCRRSRELAEQIGDTYGLIIALSDLTKAYSSLGNHIQTFGYLQQLLSSGSDKSVEPIQLCLCFARAAWTLYSEGFVAASLDYQKAALELALELNELTMICTSYVHLGMIHAKLNNFDEALANVQRALETAKAQSDERAGSLMIAYSTLHLGSVYRQIGDLARSIANYNQSVELYTRLDFPAFIHEAHKGLVLSYIASADNSSANEELAKAIRYYEDHRAKIWDQSNRNTFFDLENDIYDIAIDFEYSRMGSPRTAFDYSELNKGRSLSDLIHSGGPVTDEERRTNPELITQPLGFAQIQDKLPPRAEVVQYAVLDDKLVIWFFTKHSFQARAQSITSKALSELVQNYSLLVSAPGSDPEDLSRLARELYALLIAPVEPFFDTNAQLFIVADKFLFNVPFRALMSPATGRYLIENYSLALSPSSSVLITCTEASNRKQGTTRESALSVGVTHFDHNEDRDLPDLPSAAKEAREVASNYASSIFLINERARKKEVLREIAKADVIHLASHFISSNLSPLRSRLLLWNEPGDDPNSGIPNGILESSEIYKVKLPTAKLVVLSACQTGIERYYRGEGAISLAHAFIAAGVPLVVASLWAVDSDSTTELMINFHRNRKREASSSAEALRRAQLAMLNGSDSRYRHPYYWASFNLIGGFADY